MKLSTSFPMRRFRCASSFTEMLFATKVDIATAWARVALTGVYLLRAAISDFTNHGAAALLLA